MKYTIYKIENGLGDIWYQVKAKSWLVSYWVDNPYRNSRDNIKSFVTKEQCHSWMENQKDYEKKIALRKQIKITELPGLDRE